MESMNRNAKQGATLFEKLGVLIAGILFVLALIAGIVLGVFWMTGEVEIVSLRWWTTILTVIYLPSVIIVWNIASRESKAHLKGFARGLDGAQMTLTSIGKGLSATASIARASKPAMPTIRTDDLLPQIGNMRLIESRQSTDDVIDL